MTSTEIATGIAVELGQAGICICPDFLSATELKNAQDDLSFIYAEGRFSRAGVGRGLQHAVRDLVRRDEVCWLERSRPTPTQATLWEKFDSLQMAFNRNLFLGLDNFEGHYAVYPNGGFYKRHIDSFSQENSRMVSLLLYLNKNWQPQDGGQLRIYTATSHFDIAPIGGTMVCFLSREIEHEVLPSFTNRFSLAGWFSEAKR